MRAIRAAVPAGRVYQTVPRSPVLIMPLDEHVHDGLHRVNGTGEWLELGADQFAPLLTTTDAVFLQRASAGSALAWFEALTDEDGLWQVAAVWIDGAVAMKPNLMRAGENRPSSLRPIHAALRMVGAAGAGDAFAALGLDRFASNEDIATAAAAIEV